MAAPFVRQPFTFVQPDGSTIDVIGTGNQFEARFETPDGRPVARDPVSGFYHYADPNSGPHMLQTLGIRAGVADAVGLDEAVVPPGAGSDLPPERGFLDRSPSRWQQRRAERRMIREVSTNLELQSAPPQRQTIGQFVGLTLLIEFPDVVGTIAKPEVEAFCNNQGYNDFGNNGSVRDYFFDVSGQKVDYRNIVAPYYQARNPRAYYTNEKIPQPIRTLELINEALEHHVAAGFDFTPLTADDQNYVYALNIFYAGPVINGWSKGLWPHSHHLDQPFALPGGKQIYDYQITDMGDELTLGTFCHENGHMICDFPDLYDYGSKWAGVGMFCLMCAGGVGQNKKNPAQVGAYLRHSAGWAASEVPMNVGDSVTLDAGQNECAILRLSETEYYVVENREQSGRDALLPSAGLAVWHVDETGSNSNEPMTPTKRHECALLQADGRSDLEHNFGLGDAGDLFHAGGNDQIGNATNPPLRWWNGQGAGVSITEISAAGPSMTFKVV